MKVLIVGMNPSSRPTELKLRKNSTFDRINRWMDSVGVKHYSFFNTFDDVSDEPKTSKVDWAKFDCIDEGYTVLALGAFVSTVLNKAGIKHFKLPHPSPRNRLFNDKDFEKEMIKQLKKELR